MSNSIGDGLDRGREALRRFLVGDDDMKTMLTNIVVIATESVGGGDLASITMMRGGRPTTPVFTDDTALELDEVQYHEGGGPCLAAMAHRGIEQVTVADDGRWPVFLEAAAARGVSGVLSVPFVHHDDVLGGLNMYSTTQSRFDDGARDALALFADQLGVAAARAVSLSAADELARQLREAMESRAVIEQAKGIIIARSGVDAEAAFKVLQLQSQNENRKLREIAAEIVQLHSNAERRSADGAPSA